MGISTKAVRLCAMAAVAVFAATGVEAAVSFTTGNLVLTRVTGNGSALTSNATQVDLVEMTTAGALVQTITMPTADNGSTHAYAASGTQAEQFLTLSADKHYLVLVGYNATLGTTSPASNNTVARVIGRVDSNGNVDTSTMFTATGSASNNNARSVYSADGSTMYATTANAGTVYLPYGNTTATAATVINSTNSRNVMASGGQLYITSGSGTNTFKGVDVVGSGMPTSGPQALTRLNGMTDSTITSAWDFFFADANTLYVADDDSSATIGGLQKWVFNGTAWSMAYRIFSDGTTSSGLRSLTGVVNGDSVTLYGTTNEAASSQNRLLTLTDSLSNTVAANAPQWTLLASSGTNMQFRGVEFVPTAIPEPASFGLLALGGLALARRSRKA